MCTHATIYVSSCYICVLILLYVCPHLCGQCFRHIGLVSGMTVRCTCCMRGHLCIYYVETAPFFIDHMYVSSHYHIFVLILYVCPHTSICVSSHDYICALILLYMCPHTAIYVSSYCYICVLALLYVCPHSSIYASSCYGGILLPMDMIPFYFDIFLVVHVCPRTTICVLILLYICPQKKCK